MNKEEDYITLFPSNWLYNAGVVGMIEVMDAAKSNCYDIDDSSGLLYLHHRYFNDDQNGIPLSIKNLVNHIVKDDELSDWLKEGKKKSNQEKYKDYFIKFGDFGYKFIRAGNKLFASNTPYQNLVQLTSEWQTFEFSALVKNVPNTDPTYKGKKCDICANRYIKYNEANKLQKRIANLQSTHLSGIGPSFGEFPNGFWNLDSSMSVCDLCVFLIIHHHLTLTRLSDGSNVFINTPSFKVTYHLNKFAKGILGGASTDKFRDKRTILALSLIEYIIKIQGTLGNWTMMNIELISKYRGGIDYFTIPEDILNLISDRKIAAQLSSLGEIKILNLVLDRKFKNLMEIGYRLMKESMSARRNTKYIYDILYWERNRINLLETANQIFKLYALIEEKYKMKKYIAHG